MSQIAILCVILTAIHVSSSFVQPNKVIITYDSDGRHIVLCPDTQYFDMRTQRCRNCTICPDRTDMYLRSCSKYQNAICARLYHRVNKISNEDLKQIFPRPQIKIGTAIAHKNHHQTTISPEISPSDIASNDRVICNSDDCWHILTYTLASVMVISLLALTVLLCILLRNKLRKRQKLVLAQTGCDGGDLRLVGERHTIDPDPEDMTRALRAQNLYTLCTPIYKPSAVNRLPPTDYSRYLPPLDNNRRPRRPKSRSLVPLIPENNTKNISVINVEADDNNINDRRCSGYESYEAEHDENLAFLEFNSNSNV